MMQQLPGYISIFRFDSEMKRMEDEMNKFRSELISRQADTFRKTSTRYVTVL